MLEAVKHPLTEAEAKQALAGGQVSVDRLVQLELLRREGETYRLNYLLLTIEDQQTIYRIASRYGRSLADAFLVHRAEFEQIAERYPDAALRPQLLFGLVAGAALNWDGLELTTELGYRIRPSRHPSGEVYIVHSKERGAKLNLTGLYLDSQTVSGSKMSFSTFGDGESLPRRQGLPDVFDGIEAAVEGWRKLPAIYAALRSEYIAYFLEAMEDAGQVMNAIVAGLDPTAVTIPEARRKATLQLLISVGYLRENGGRYMPGIPVLTARDKPQVDAALTLSRTIMTGWLRQNYSAIEKELTGLSPMRNGVPFSLAFSEVWHYEFGFAAKFLAESGFYADPRAPGSRYEGYVPLVWASSLLKAPGQ